MKCLLFGHNSWMLLMIFAKFYNMYYSLYDWSYYLARIIILVVVWSFLYSRYLHKSIISIHFKRVTGRIAFSVLLLELQTNNYIFVGSAQRYALFALLVNRLMVIVARYTVGYILFVISFLCFEFFSFFNEQTNKLNIQWLKNGYHIILKSVKFNTI